MIKGIIFFETGGIQLIGELHSLSGIITTIKELLPSLEKQEAERVFKTLSTEQIAELIKQREEQETEL